MTTLYRVVEFKDNTFNFGSTLSNNEYIEIKAASEKVSSIWKEMDFLDHIKIAYEDYIEWESESDPNKIVRLINSYLSAYREFIDGWGAYTKRKKSNKISELWLASVQKVYEESFEYRFIYNLRNYVQHVHGKPYSDSHQTINGSTLFLDKQMFIDNHKNMQKTFKTELEENSINFIDVDKAIKKVHQDLINLQEKIFFSILEEEHMDISLSRAAFNVLKFYQKHAEEKGSLFLTDFDIRKYRDYQDKATMRQYDIPVGLARLIGGASQLSIELEGEIVGKSPDLPFKIEKSNQIYTGSKYVYSAGVEWVRLTHTKTTNRLYEQSDKYSAIYMLNCFSLEEFEEFLEIRKKK